MTGFETLKPEPVVFDLEESGRMMELMRRDDPTEQVKVWPSQLAKIMAGDYCPDNLAKPSPWTESVYSIAGKIAHKAFEWACVTSRDLQTPSELTASAWKALEPKIRVGDVDVNDALVRAEHAVTNWYEFMGEYRENDTIKAEHPVTESRVSCPRLSGVIDATFGAQEVVSPTEISTTKTIVDWKTGQPSDTDMEQLWLYALLHTSKFGSPPARIACVYLKHGYHVAFQDVDMKLLKHRYGRMQDAMHVMRTIKESADPERVECSACRFCTLDCPSAG